MQLGDECFLLYTRGRFSLVISFIQSRIKVSMYQSQSHNPSDSHDECLKSFFIFSISVHFPLLVVVVVGVVEAGFVLRSLSCFEFCLSTSSNNIQCVILTVVCLASCISFVTLIPRVTDSFRVAKQSRSQSFFV